jgi:glycine hydroxymethyltransferase
MQSEEMVAFNSIEEIQALVNGHTEWRAKCMNVIGSENIPSASVRKFLTCDFVGRYPSYRDDPTQRFYQGNRYMVEIEMRARELGKKLFGAAFIDLRPLGGKSAGVGVICGLMEPGDTVFETDAYDGGHCLATAFCGSNLLKGMIHAKYLSYGNDHDLDIEVMRRRILQERPKLIIYGRSVPLFPESTKALREEAEKVGAYVAYDGSHVMGFLATHTWPNPLDEGCDVVFGSTHKTFPGPQGGLIFTRNEELFRKIRPGFTPSVVGNYHPERMPAMAAALVEMAELGPACMRQTIRNSRALGKALHDQGMDALFPERGFSSSHQVVLDVGRYGDGKDIADRLEEANIICGATVLPKDRKTKGQSRSGLRIGTQEITRIGMVESDMENVAKFMKRVVTDKEEPASVAKDVAKFASQFKELKYAFEKGTRPYKLLF